MTFPLKFCTHFSFLKFLQEKKKKKYPHFELQKSQALHWTVWTVQIQLQRMAQQIAILGAGIFVKTQYIPRLAEISDLVSLKFIWSRSEVNHSSIPLTLVYFYAIRFIIWFIYLFLIRNRRKVRWRLHVSILPTWSVFGEITDLNRLLKMIQSLALLLCLLDKLRF